MFIMLLVCDKDHSKLNILQRGTNLQMTTRNEISMNSVHMVNVILLRPLQLSHSKLISGVMLKLSASLRS